MKALSKVGRTLVLFASTSLVLVGTSIFKSANAQGINLIACQTPSNDISVLRCGYDTVATNPNSTAVGYSSEALATGSTAIGAGSEASATDSTAIGSNASAAASNSVAIGTDSVADEENTLSVGVPGTERQIVNVAAGTDATDAANVGQMKAADTVLQTQIATNATAITAVETVNATQSSQISALNTQIGAINTNISGMQADIESLFDLREVDRRDMKQGIAAAVAIGSAQMPSQPGRISYVVNGARFRGENAVGGSMMYRLNTASPMAVGVGFSFAGNKNNAVRVGIAGEF